MAATYPLAARYPLAATYALAATYPSAATIHWLLHIHFCEVCLDRLVAPNKKYGQQRYKANGDGLRHFLLYMFCSLKLYYFPWGVPRAPLEALGRSMGVPWRPIRMGCL